MGSPAGSEGAPAVSAATDFAAANAPDGISQFTSEFAIAVAGIYAGKTWLIVLCLIFLTIALAGLTTMLLKTVLGKPKEGIEVGELNKSSVVVLATYLLLLLFMGIYISEPILQLLTNAVGIVLGQPNVSFGDMLVLPWQNLAQ